MKTNKDYTLTFRNYGEITVPKGTEVSHRTATGIDPKYHFVEDLSWIDKNYPEYPAIMLKYDVETYGIDVPVQFVDL